MRGLLSHSFSIPEMFWMGIPRNQPQEFSLRLKLSPPWVVGSSSSGPQVPQYLSPPIPSLGQAFQIGDPEDPQEPSTFSPLSPRQVSQVGANKTNYSRSHPISN